MLRQFGFSEEPFGATPDPRCLYGGPTQREALASLKYGFSSGRGFTALIAAPGLGKTTLLFRFLEDIRGSARSVFLFDIDSQCEPRELLAYILRDVGITPASGFAEMHQQLNGILVAEARAGRKFVLVIDEAQNLSDSALEMVRLLSNFETPRAKLMQIVLSGQPQLSDKLRQPCLVQLRQRISTICRLQPLSLEESRAYVDHRLKWAGYRGEQLFTEEALEMIAKASQGIPRSINNLCFNALSLCWALQRKQVDGRIAAEAISDQQLMPESTEVFPARFEVACDQPATQQREQAVGAAWLWVGAVSVLMAVAWLGRFRLAKPLNSESRKVIDLHPSDLKVQRPQILAPPPPTVDTGKLAVTTAPKSAAIAIRVEPHQTLAGIALEYLGSSDMQRLRQIQALNPKLIDPDHIVTGQTIRLPSPTAATLEENAMIPVNARHLP